MRILLTITAVTSFLIHIAHGMSDNFDDIIQEAENITLEPYSDENYQDEMREHASPLCTSSYVIVDNYIRELLDKNRMSNIHTYPFHPQEITHSHYTQYNPTHTEKRSFSDMHIQDTYYTTPRINEACCKSRKTTHYGNATAFTDTASTTWQTHNDNYTFSSRNNTPLYTHSSASHKYKHYYSVHTDQNAPDVTPPGNITILDLGEEYLALCPRCNLKSNNKKTHLDTYDDTIKKIQDHENYRHLAKYRYVCTKCKHTPYTSSSQRSMEKHLNKIHRI